MRARRNRKIILMLIGIVIAIMLIMSLFFLLKNEPEEVVEEFYTYEAAGEFGKSWELFHSEMDDQFPEKGKYIENRGHVFMQHMEVDTFTFEVGDAKKHKHWQMRSGAPTLREVYEIPVTQTFDSRFGKFVLQQNCFVVKEEDEWKILWDYNY
ncbi:hypothetical protein [Bacillus sp. V59.32b]|uniref:hypothetical protein n=1 Tax=Bacillus sp. V59.32b TaxID=1758642 RepID=UPI000E3D454D|nr:hypothetical protein [Bacillus sp. V59.32b]RFU61507.1 hypothetical protein D0463_15010 [Bacillus sp. V59.32b]